MWYVVGGMDGCAEDRSGGNEENPILPSIRSGRVGGPTLLAPRLLTDGFLYTCNQRV